MSNCLQLDHVDYAYGAAKILVLSDVSADFESGKMYAITGPSGAGKSTLLALLAGLDAPSRGVVRFEGEDIAASGYAKHRREHVSLVFQDHNLIDYLTPEENLRLVSAKADMKILEELGLSREESKRNIMHLSGGQRQQVAVRPRAGRAGPRDSRGRADGQPRPGDDRRGDSSAAARRPSDRQMRDRGDAFQARRRLRRCRAASQEQETDPGVTSLSRAAPIHRFGISAFRYPGPSAFWHPALRRSGTPAPRRPTRVAGVPYSFCAIMCVIVEPCQ